MPDEQVERKGDGRVYGIDLGTTYSVIATIDPQTDLPKVIRNDYDQSDTLASAVYFPEGGGEVAVGETAKETAWSEPDRVAQFAKRWIGRPEGEAVDGQTWDFAPDGQKVSPIEVSAYVLKRLKTYADEQGEDVVDVVVTVPAYFGNDEKAATRQAAESAGLNVLDMVHEPTAAAISYFSQRYAENRRVLVFDLGGGTFDLTLDDFTLTGEGDEKRSTIEVIRTVGDHALGGKDWDERLYSILLGKLAAEQGLAVDDVEEEDKAELRGNVEKAKRDLSLKPTAKVRVAHDKVEVTCDEFEAATKDLVDRCMGLVDQVLTQGNRTADDVDDVLLVGGSTLMPMIQNAVNAKFGADKVHLEDPHLAVAKGAALTALYKVMENMDNSQSDPNPNPDPNPVPRPHGYIKPLPMPAPVVIDKLTRSVGPAILVGDALKIQNLLFVGDKVGETTTQVYSTVADNQPSIKVDIYENLSEDRNPGVYITPPVDAEGNQQETDPALMVKSLGTVTLQLPPNTPADTPIAVKMSTDQSGLHVTATNNSTGEEAKADMSSANLLSEEEQKKLQQRVAGTDTVGDTD